MAEGSSSVDSSQGPSETENHEISPEDRQTIVRLYQKRPKLWAAFRHILSVVDLLSTKTHADRQLYESMMKLCLNVEGQIQTESEIQQKDDLYIFVTVSGFVEKSVSFARRLLNEMGMEYVTYLPELSNHSSSGFAMECLRLIRGHLLNCSATSPEFRLRLTKTGYLKDLAEDLKHIQHMSVEALERGNVFLLSLGTIHNCCLSPQCETMIKQLDITPHITPFIAKRGPSHFIQSIALAVMAHVAEEDQLDLLSLDAELLQYFLKNIQTALEINRASHSNWMTSEILCDLSLVARNTFNKRLMVAQGILSTLRSVLDPPKKRFEQEKQHAMSIISQLIEDPINLQVCQNYQEMLEVLKRLQESETKETAENANSIMQRLEQPSRQWSESIHTLPCMATLLGDQCNFLDILDIGPAEFILDQLKAFIEPKQSSTCVRPDVSCSQVLLALVELLTEDVYRREIMSRGGLDIVQTVLQKGTMEEKAHAARIVLELVMDEENKTGMKINPALMTQLIDLKERTDNKELSEVAETILLALNQ